MTLKNNELYVCGLDLNSRVYYVGEDDIIKNFRDEDVIKVFADTGRPYKGVVENIEDSWAGGNISWYNEEMYLTDGYASVNTFNIQPNYMIRPDSFYKDGKMFHLKNYDLINPSEYIDADQHYVKASYITNKGLLCIGQMKNNGQHLYILMD